MNKFELKGNIIQKLIAARKQNCYRSVLNITGENSVKMPPKNKN